MPSWPDLLYEQKGVKGLWEALNTVVVSFNKKMWFYLSKKKKKTQDVVLKMFRAHAKEKKLGLKRGSACKVMEFLY